KVNPATKTFNSVPPFLTIPHHNSPALGIVLFQAKLHDSSLTRNAEFLVDLVLNGYAMVVRAEAALNMVPLHGPVPRDNVLDGRGEQMAVMREAGREGRSIEKGVIGIPLRELDLGAESQHSACGRITGMGDMRTCRSKALISRHLAIMAS